VVDFEDLPVRPDYADQVRARAIRVRTVSRWLNALSVDAAPEAVWSLAALDGVERLDVVRAFRRGETPAPDAPDSSSAPAAGAGARNPIYGAAFGQLNQIHVPALHQQGLSGRGVVVCLLDVGTGVRGVLFNVILSPVRPRKVVVVDAVDLGRTPGEVWEIEAKDLPKVKQDDFSMHQLPTSDLLRELNDLGRVRVTCVVAQVSEFPGEVIPGLSAAISVEPSTSVNGKS
jgi:hydrogenase maturation protease